MRNPNRHKELRDCSKRSPSRLELSTATDSPGSLGISDSSKGKRCVFGAYREHQEAQGCLLWAAAQFAWPEPGGGGGEAE